MKRLIKSSRRYRLGRAFKRTPGLVGYWCLCAGSFGTTTLRKSNALGTDLSFASPSWIYDSGKVALFFDGTGTSTGSVTLTPANALFFTQNNISAFTVVVFGRSLGDGGNGFGRAVNQAHVDQFIIKSNSYYVLLDTQGGGANYGLGGSLTINVPAMMALSYEMTGTSTGITKSFVNGTEVASSTSTIGGFVTGDTATQALMVGTEGTSPFNGYIYQLAIYKGFANSASVMRNISHKAGLL